MEEYINYETIKDNINLNISDTTATVKIKILGRSFNSPKELKDKTYLAPAIGVVMVEYEVSLEDGVTHHIHNVYNTEGKHIINVLGKFVDIGNFFDYPIIKDIQYVLPLINNTFRNN